MYKFILSLDIGSLFVKSSIFLSNELQNKYQNQIKTSVLNLKKTPYTLKLKDKEYGDIFILAPIKLGKDNGEYKDASFITEEIKSNIQKTFNINPELIFVTGRAKDFAKENGYIYISEFKAISEFFKTFFPKIKSVLEIGAENSKYLAIDNGIITDYETNGECAAGTGAFLDQQAHRLNFEVEDISNEALSAEKTAYIAGRCSVFAKSDMIHAQQKGYTPQEILKGLTDSVAENYKANILKTKEYNLPVAFIGGVAQNKAVSLALQNFLELSNLEFVVPDFPHFVHSMGLATLVNYKSKTIVKEPILDKSFPLLPKLDTKNVIFLRDKVQTRSLDNNIIDVFLGIDIGSVSTNLVLIDTEGVVIKEKYLRTSGRPIEAVNIGLKEINETISDKINVIGVATTGSGRELIGELIGADFVKDEITAHNKGASFISKKYFNKPVDTIFEIGGQDSKFISIKDGVVVDFHMNEACSAGTGSFLEEQAEKLGIKIKDEFSNLALSAKSPINLGDRCTVFIEKDLNSYYEKGANIEDLLSGLSYSIVNNYLNRVVKGRPIGDTIYFQGGTAYNDSVASAFAQVLGKTIIVPPHNGVMGALGMALISLEKYKIRKYQTKFRGYDLNNVNYTLREFTCNSCVNKCTMQEFTVEGKKTYWGDKCSEKFRKTAKTDLKPTGIDFIKERENLLFKEYNLKHIDLNKNHNSLFKKPNRPIIGFARAMYFWDYLPFWASFIDSLGFNLLLSDPSNSKIAKSASRAVVSSPCFPIKMAHGHTLNLMKKKPDYILSPSMINAKSTIDDKDKSVGRPQFYYCPWGQTLPDVINNNKKFASYKDKFIKPKLEFREGDSFVINDLYKEFKKFFPNINKKQVKLAYQEGIRSLETFKNTLYLKYLKEIQTINEQNREAIILIGRPYNINDSGINLNIPRKLRDNYGVNVIPMDFMPILDRTNEITDNMFWNYGRKILSTLREIADKNNFHPIYITNFECGPDSYIKHFVTKALNGKSSLTIQFDEHGNDAGILTRCEAYLDSKGVFDYNLYHSNKKEYIEQKEKNTLF